MKKLITLAIAVVLAASAHAANIKLFSLLNGYNVLIQTNITVGFGNSNIFYTTIQGQAVYSWTNNTVFTTSGSNTATTIVQSNLVANDAFKPIDLFPDANGDYNSTATLVLYTGNTNWSPNNYWQTNANGLVYLGTNVVGSYWPLAASIFPNWQYPATPNAYPTLSAANESNTITISLYPGSGNPSSSADVPASYPVLYSSTAIWSATYVVAAGIPNCVMTNIPAVSLQQMRKVYATITCSGPTSGMTTSTNEIVNFIGIYQPVP